MLRDIEHNKKFQEKGYFDFENSNIYNNHTPLEF